MQIITPIEITDDILTSPIAEPDISAGEVEWEDKSIPTYYPLITAPQGVDAGGGYTESVLADNGRVFFAGADVGVLNTDGSTEFISSLVIQVSAMATRGDYIYMGLRSGRITKMHTSSHATSGIAPAAAAEISCAITASNGYIYLFNELDIIKIDPVNDQLSYFDTNIDNISSVTEGQDGFLYFITSSISYGSTLYKFDMDGGIITEILTLGSRYYCCESGSDGYIYLAGFSGDISRYSLITQSATTFGIVEGVILDMELMDNGSLIGVGYAPSEIGTAYLINPLSSSVSVIFNDKYQVSGDKKPASIRTLVKKDQNYIFSFFTYRGAGKIGSLPTSYQESTRAILPSTHKIYESLSVNYDNPVVGAELTPPSWVKVSATNKYKMFDYSINTASSSVGDIELLPAQTATTLSMYGMGNISSVNVVVKENSSSGAEIYNVTKDLTLPTPVDDMIANEALYRSKVMFSDLPVFANPWINIVINRADTAENWSIGDIAIGNARTMGVVVYQSSTSRTSYDSVETDDFGNETIISRPSAEYTTFELSLQPIYADYVERILKDSLNKPRVYIGDKGNNEKLFTFGYYERSPITYVSPSLCETTLKVRGLV